MPATGQSIERKVQFLSRPNAYAEGATRVDVVETHYSWVFLTDNYAYKMKKPLRGAGFDFRTIEARHQNAMTELRLNRRLARNVYLAVVPLTAIACGRLAIGGTGVPVDWLVKMVRLEASRMLDLHLASGKWRRGDIEPIACHLASFFARSPRAVIAPPKYLAQLKNEITSSVTAFAAAGIWSLLTAAQPVARRLAAFLIRHRQLFWQRIHDRRLVEGHGDLRPEHIYVNGTPRIIDCVEFRPDLRRGDPVSELAFLGLECRRLGGPAIEDLLLRRYQARTGDALPRELLRFYAALHGLVRARIAIQHLADYGKSGRVEWTARAAAYLALAAEECRFLSR